jgi:hypothetical protein
LYAGLDLSRKKVDVCLLSGQGEHLDQLAVPPDVDSLRTLARRIEEVHREPVCAVIESMTGARLVHATLEQEGWSVEIADAQKVKGLAPLACKTDKIDAKVLATLSPARPPAFPIQAETKGPGIGAARDSRCSADLVEPARLHVVDETPHLILLGDEGAFPYALDRVADITF